MQQSEIPLKTKIQIWVLKDKTTGEVWSTPNKKASWSAKGHAKNAWNVHNWREPRFESPDATHNLEAVCIGEYVLK